MPAVPLHCPLCAGLFQVESEWAGQHVACPHCQGVIAVPPEPGSENKFDPANGEAASARPPPVGAGMSEASAMDLLPPGTATSARRSSSAVAKDSRGQVPPRVEQHQEATQDWLPATAAIVPPPTAIPSETISQPAPGLSSFDPQPPARIQEPRPIRRLSPQERAERRLFRNAIVFGLCIAVLVAVFYYLAR